MMKYILRKARKDDTQAILEMGKGIVDKYERTHLGDTMVDEYINSGDCDADFIKYLDNTTLLVLGEDIIGLIIWIDNIIQGFLIDIPYWGTGAAQYLMGSTLDTKFQLYDEVTLECFESSPRANAFYKKMGWEKVGLIEEDLANRVMYKKLKSIFNT